jgi:hypothetical protein
VTVADDPIEPGQQTTATAIGVDQFGAPVNSGPATYISDSSVVAGVNPVTGRIVGFTPGTITISATIDRVTGQQTLTVANAAIRLNEIVPNGAAPGGWVELFNPTGKVVDMSGWTLTASNVFETVEIPAGRTIEPHGYLVIDEETFPHGLQFADAVHLFSRYGVQVDSFSWAGDPAASYGRCPDGAGPFVTTVAATRGLANACGEADH